MRRERRDGDSAWPCPGHLAMLLSTTQGCREHGSWNRGANHNHNKSTKKHDLKVISVSRFPYIYEHWKILTLFSDEIVLLTPSLCCPSIVIISFRLSFTDTFSQVTCFWVRLKENRLKYHNPVLVKIKVHLKKIKPEYKGHSDVNRIFYFRSFGYKKRWNLWKASGDWWWLWNIVTCLTIKMFCSGGTSS